MAGNTVRIRGVFEDQVSGPLAGITKRFRALDDAVKGSGAFARVFQGIGLSIGTMAWTKLSGAIGSVGDVVGDAIDAASDLNESLSKSQVVFGRSATAIEAWAGTMARAGGLSKQAALEAAASFGNLFTGLGQSQASAAEMSKRLVQLASDLASFNNLDPTEALEKLRSGLAGETEPLRSVGVFLTEAKVKAKAMEMGLADAHGELSEGAKVLARYQLILDETKTAQGDFARTADSVANKQRQLNAEIENLKAQLGEALLPVQKDVLSGLLDLTGGLGAVGSIIRRNLGVQTSYIESLRDQANALATNLALFGGISPRAAEWRAELERTLQALHDATEGYDDYAIRLRLSGQLAGGLAEATDDAAEATDKAAEKSAKLTKRLKDSIPTLRDARRSWEDLGGTITEAIFGPAVLAGREAGLQRRLKEIKEEMRKEKDPLRIKELKGDLADTQGQLVETRLKLALLGDTAAAWGAKDKLRPWVKGLISDMSDLDKETQAAISSLARLLSIAPNAPQASPFQVRARAHGGPVWPGAAFLVGERGPELFVPSVSGTIVPSAQSRVVVHTHVNLDGRQIAEVVDEHLGWRSGTAMRTARPV